MKVSCAHAAWVALALSFSLHAEASAGEERRGGHVQWARLKTDYVFWSRHVATEGRLLDYVRENTSLDIDATWAAADLGDLDSLTAYPFLYAEGIQTVRDAKAQGNLREYLLRGGFLLIDSCINPKVNPDPDAFLAGQIRRFSEILPRAVIRPIPAGHEIYRCFFTLRELPHSYMKAVFDPRWARHPLYTVQVDDRLVAIISLAGLKCGWSFPDNGLEHQIASMQMLVNIYTHALMR